jgi:CDP-diacylglycerol--serine O-phosphatidyltransferase
MHFPPLRQLTLASLITTLGAVCGLCSVVLAARGLVALACTAVGLSILFDFLDGFVARGLKQTSAFGAQLDSLADAMSFCAAPALVTWHAGLDGPAAVVLVAYFACGVWRLAHFDVTGLDDSGRFSGVPTTNAACWWLFIMALLHALQPTPEVRTVVWCSFFAIAAVLMVSSVRVPKRGWYPVAHGVGVALAVFSLWLVGPSSVLAG